MRTFPDVVGQRSETVRRSNLSGIARAVHAGGPLSRSELVAHTGLTRTVRSLVGELVDGGMLVETRNEPAGVPGRPSPLVHADPDGARRLLSRSMWTPSRPHGSGWGEPFNSSSGWIGRAST